MRMCCLRCLALTGKMIAAAANENFCGPCLPLKETAYDRFEGPDGIGTWLKSPQIGRLTLTGAGIAEMSELAQIPRSRLTRMKYIGPIARDRLLAALEAWRQARMTTGKAEPNARIYEDEWSYGGG